MKIVQSQWSKPGENQNIAEENKGGWLKKKYNYFSWTLSALQLKKFYNNIELVTDKTGYELLINKLELPYSSVIVELDSLNHYPKDLFVLGKVYSYSLQNEPFIHVDSDIFIWKEFESKLVNSPLLCQNPEDGNFYNEHYFTIFYSMIKSFDYCPEILNQSILKNERIKAVSAGIIGGQNVDFFKIYKSKVFEFAERNMAKFSKINVKYSNIVFEQFLFYALAEEMGIDISYLSSETQIFLSSILDFTGVPKKNEYIHLYSGVKKTKLYVDCLEYRLQKDHPTHYYKIINLLKTNQI